MEIQKTLLTIQQKLKVEKNQYNKFGKFSYRSKEDILEALKPLLAEENCTIICDDKPLNVADGYTYIETTATLTNCETGETVSAKGYAREPLTKKGMDESQITGTASSYAGKRALGNLFAIDDTADSDHYAPDTTLIGVCTACGMRYQFQSKEQMANSQCQCGNTSFKAE